MGAINRDKDPSIETLRGLAILLVVAGYIIRDDLGSHGKSLADSVLSFSYYLLKPIRMPLFTVISAYLYAAWPARHDTLKKLVEGKARRILIPFALVSALQYLAYSQFLSHGRYPLGEIYKIYLWPFEQFWFLYSIFCIFILVGLLDAFKALDSFRRWCIFFALSFALNALFKPPRTFSLDGTNYLLTFFLLGYGFRRYPDRLFSPRMLAIYAALAIAAYVPYITIWMTRVIRYPPKILGLIISVSAVPLIFRFRMNVPFFAKIGYYAFGIHIFNKIAMMPVRVLFERYGMPGDGVVFASYLLSGVAIAIGLHLVAERVPFTRRYVLGIKDPVPALAVPALASVPQVELPRPQEAAAAAPTSPSR